MTGKNKLAETLTSPSSSADLSEKPKPFDDLLAEAESSPELETASEPKKSTSAYSTYSAKRSKIAPIIAAGQMGNKFITATFKMDSYAKMHNVPPLIEISLIAARMTCVFFVSAKSTKDKMKIPCLKCDDPNLKDADYELSWLDIQFYFAKQNKLSKLETFFTLITSYAFRGRYSDSGETYFFEKMNQFAKSNNLELKNSKGEACEFGTKLLSTLANNINPRRKEINETFDYNNPEKSIASVFRLIYLRFHERQNDLNLDFNFTVDSSDQLDINLSTPFPNTISFINKAKPELWQLITTKKSELKKRLNSLKTLEKAKIQDGRGNDLNDDQKKYAAKAKDLYKESRQCIYEIVLCQAFLEIDDLTNRKKVIALLKKHFEDEKTYSQKLLAIDLTSKQIETNLKQRRDITSQHLSCHAGKYETALRNYSDYVSDINTFVFASFAGLAGFKVAKLIAPYVNKALRFFKIRQANKAKIMSGLQDTFSATSATIAGYVSQNFGKDGIRNTYSSFGRFIDSYKSNATNKKKLRLLVGINSAIALASVATTPLLYLGAAAGVKVLVGGLISLSAVCPPAALIAIGLAAIALAGITLYLQRKSRLKLTVTTTLLAEVALAVFMPCPTTWAALAASLVAIAAVGSVGIFCSQASKIKKATKIIKLEYKKAQANGPLSVFFFGIKVALGLTAALATIAISVAGDIYGFKTIAHHLGADQVVTKIFANVTAACSGLCNSVQNLTDTTEGVLKKINEKVVSITESIKDFKQSKFSQTIKQAFCWLLGTQYTKPVVEKPKAKLSSNEIILNLLNANKGSLPLSTSTTSSAPAISKETAPQTTPTTTPFFPPQSNRKSTEAATLLPSGLVLANP